MNSSERALNIPARLNLRQLRALLLLVEFGSFTGAAKQLHVTQSALSGLIKELEQAVGVRLFDRHTRAVRLTAAGVDFHQAVQKTLTDLDQAVHRLQDLSELREGRVRVVASTVVSAGLLSGAFRDFRAQHPRVQLELRDVAEEQILATVESGAVDFGIGTSIGSDRELDELPLFDDKFIALCCANHPLARRRRVPWKLLSAQPFIALARGSPIRQLIDDAIHANGVRLQIVNEVSFATTVLSLVGAGLGVSVLPMNNHPYLSAFGVHAAELVDPVITRKVSIFTPRYRAPSPAAAAFISFLQARVST